VEVPLSLDTPLDVERRQVEAWRRMTDVEKAEIITGLTQAAYAMTWAGVRARHPEASPREQFLRVAFITLGPVLAREVYPDARGLVTSS
jgi:hypothetical protein